MKKLVGLIVLLAMGAATSQSYAANSNSKPNCPKGQIAVLDGKIWQCKAPAIKSNTNTNADTSKSPVVTYGPVITIKPKGMHD